MPADGHRQLLTNFKRRPSTLTANVTIGEQMVNTSLGKFPEYFQESVRPHAETTLLLGISRSGLHRRSMSGIKDVLLRDCEA